MRLITFAWEARDPTVTVPVTGSELTLMDPDSPEDLPVAW